jgi:hypothetical protein
MANCWVVNLNQRAHLKQLVEGFEAVPAAGSAMAGSSVTAGFHKLPP